MSVPELKTAIASLPPADLAALAEWFQHFVADEWDRKIEEDIRAGRLDAAGDQADADFDAGRAPPL